MRAGKDTVRIEGESAFQEIIGGIAVEKRSDARTFRSEVGIANDDQSFFFVGDVKKTVKEMDGLLFVFEELLAKRVDAEGSR